MKLSTRVRFGLRIMMQLGLEGRTQPIFGGRIAEAQGLSEPYVDQLLAPLRAGGLVMSRRGRRGGYMLARPPSEITVLEIVEVLEGKLTLVDCTDAPDVCGRSSSCATRQVWLKLSNAIRDTLGSITLEEVCREQERLSSRILYYI